MNSRSSIFIFKAETGDPGESVGAGDDVSDDENGEEEEAKKEESGEENDERGFGDWARESSIAKGFVGV